MIKQTQAELLNHLKEQIEFLKSSCSLYDAGIEAEAKRIAGTLRTLLHTTYKKNGLINSISLLNQLNKTNVMFCDLCANYDSRSCGTFQGLVHIDIGDNARYIPLLEGLPSSFLNKKLNFGSWRERSVVMVDDTGRKYYRKDLITKISNKDGGNHIQAELENDYHHLTRENSTSWVFTKQGVEEPFSNRAELASIRQIGQEVIKTLSKEFSL